MGLHGTDVHAAVVYVGFVGDFEIFGSLMDPIFGCNLWLIAGKVYDSYFYIFYFILILRWSFVPVFFTAARFSSLFTSFYLHSSYWYLLFLFVDCCVFAVTN